MDKKKYSIGLVSERTGISTQLIRQWENRYQVIEPERTDSNRRLYSDTDIYKLGLLHRATQQGHSISNVVHLSIVELEKLVGDVNVKGANDSEQTEEGSEVEFLVRLLSENRFREMEKAVTEATVKHTLPILIDKIFVPLLQQVGIMWREGRLRIVHEHYVSRVIMQNLYQLIQNQPRPAGAEKIIISSLTNQMHEIGALFAAVGAASAGWDVIYPGINLPVHEIAFLMEETACSVLFLSIIYIPGIANFHNDIRNLRSLLGDKVHIITAGQAVHHFADVFSQLNISTIDSAAELIDKLDMLKLQLRDFS